jgi:hypothetical protein
MTTVVNLRIARKRRQRAEKERAAAANRAVHGRTKAEKERQRLETERAATALDGHRLEPDRGER